MKIFKREEKGNLMMINCLRFLLVNLIIFELLNYLKILRLNTQYTWLGLLITAMASWALLEYIANKFQEKRGRLLHRLIWLIVLISLSLDAAGDFFHFYGKLAWWDQLIHFFISATVCFTLFTVINIFWIDKFKFSLLFKSGRLKLSLLLAATSTLALSTLYEIEEYAEDLIFHTNRLGPGTDTADDLLFNLIGVSFVVFFIWIYYLITHRREVIK